MSVVRRAARSGLLLAAAVLCGAVPALAQAGSGPGVDGARLAFRIHDERVVESSGLALSRTHPGLAYTVNDSGDDARVLVLSLRDGSAVGETTLTGAENDDFEALAPAPGGRLLVGDIGDNDAERDSIEVYVLDEPGRGAAEVEPRTVSLTYADGPRDAEGLVVRGQRVFVVSKEALGGVYAAPVLGSAREAYRLRRVASAPGVVTDAAQLADGDVVLRDYRRGYVVEMPGWRVRASFPLPRVQQGETLAAALDGRRAYAGTEGEDSPVYLVPVPAAAESAPASVPPARSSSQQQEEQWSWLRPTGYAAAAAAAVVIGVLLRRRRRRPRIQIR
ncbi:MAG TPA: hypothetical protein VHG70_01840 [Nocardioidaceae bacterium]|nr:hypothetical protein [Nocardioidaceae bacterium]